MANEEEKTQGQEEEQTPAAEAEKQEEKIGGSAEKQHPDYVEQARQAAKELKDGLKQRAEIVEREEKILKKREAMRELGGDSHAGTQDKKPKEETPQEYKDRIMRGAL